MHKQISAPVLEHRPGHNPVPPYEGSRGYIRVVARGCGGYQDYVTLEYDCGHGYLWSCEECPVLREKWRLEDES